MVESNNFLANIKRWSKQHAPNAEWAAAAARMTVDMDADTDSGSGGETFEARFKAIEEENAKLRREMGLISTAVTDINTNVTEGFQQLMQRQQQTLGRMAALLARTQGTDASVAMIGNAVANILGTEFVMPAPTAATVTDYGGGGGTIAAAAGAGAAVGGVTGAETVAVTETALADPQMVGALYPPASPKATRGAKEPMGAPMSPEYSDGLDDGELPVDTPTAVETRLQRRLKRIACYSARLLAAPSASDDQTSGTLGTMRTKTDGRRSARLTSTTETGDDDDTALGGAATDATGGLTDGADDDEYDAPWASGLPLTVPGPPSLCRNAAIYGLQAYSQRAGSDYCCGA